MMHLVIQFTTGSQHFILAAGRQVNIYKIYFKNKEHIKNDTESFI